MSSEPDPERLRALEERMAKLTEKPKKKDLSTAKAFSQGEVAWRMVIELASGIIVGTGLGYGLDYWFGTMPIFLVILSVLGFIAGVRTMMGTARELQMKKLAEAQSGEAGTQDTVVQSTKDEG